MLESGLSLYHPDFNLNCNSLKKKKLLDVVFFNSTFSDLLNTTEKTKLTHFCMYLQMKIPLVFQISNMTMLVCQIKNKPQFRHGKKLRKINIFLLRPITSRVTKETVAYKLFLFNSYEYMILACLQSTVLILTLFTYLNVIKM